MTKMQVAGRAAAASGRLGRWLLLVALLQPVARAAEPDPLDKVKESATEWVKIRAETARIETDWRTQKPLLESTIAGLEDRATTQESKREFLEAKTAKDREEMAGYETANKAGTESMQAVETRVKALSARLLKLRPSLPPRLSTALEMSYRSLADTGLGVSERMQLNMTILNRCTQFNRSITCEDEVLNVAGGKNDQLLEVVYWGLSQGYALDRAAGKVWVGSPGPQGWHWEARPEAAPAVARMIAIYHDKSDPDFLTVPFIPGQATTKTSTN